MAALTGIIVSHANPAGTGYPDPDEALEWAYKYADAAPGARSQETNDQ